uniref:Protein kinase domain-containing protein n=1 Tax=Amphiprion ocellaris TaxID=80972 RepID=A0A3Q1CBY6_AMPOC
TKLTESEDTLVVTRSCSYYVAELLGEGGYGVVARCIKVETEEEVALKMVKESDISGNLEVYNMYQLQKHLTNHRYLIKFLDYFVCKGHYYLVLELLNKTLLDFLNERDLKPLHVMKIRPIAAQMLIALEALKRIEMVHTDIKLDNIMFDFCNMHSTLEVKLTDFGCAAKVSDMVDKDKIQVVGYRAPEVILGLPMTEAVDMWSLGAVLGTLFVGRHFYPTVSEYEQLRIIVRMQGLPRDHLLKAGRKARRYFTESHDSSGQAWRMKTCDEYEQETGEAVTRCSVVYEAFNSFRDLLKKKYSCKAEKKDTKVFISLLKRMLHMDPKIRITPREALGHDFITMKHLKFSQKFNLGYKAQSRWRMVNVNLRKYLPRSSDSDWMRYLSVMDDKADSGDLSSNTASSSENDTEGSTKASVDQAVSRRKTCILENSGGTDDEITAPLVEDVANNRKSISKSKGGTKDQITFAGYLGWLLQRDSLSYEIGFEHLQPFFDPLFLAEHFSFHPSDSFLMFLPEFLYENTPALPGKADVCTVFY